MRLGKDLRTVLGRRDLRLLLAANTVSQTGDWILATGLAFQVYALTHSTLASAAVLIASQVPNAVLGSPAGVVVDRLDCRRLMVLLNVVLAAVVVPIAAVHDAGQVWIVLVVVAVSGCCEPFVRSAEARLLPTLVGRQDVLATANALNGQVRNVARLVGAAIGGVLVGAGGLTALAVVDGVTFLGAAALVAAVRRTTPAEPAEHRVSFGRSWLDGLGVVRRSPTLVLLLVVFVGSGLGESAMGSLFAPFVHDVLGAGADAYGGILAAQAVGGIAGGAVVALVGGRIRPRALLGWGAVAFGALDLVLFTAPLVAPSVVVAAVVIALVGLPAAALSAGLVTVFQLATTDGVRGRVFGVTIAAQNVALLVGSPVAAVLADRFGIVPVIAFQGAVHVVLGVVVLVVLRRTAGVGAVRGAGGADAAGAAGPGEADGAAGPRATGAAGSASAASCPVPGAVPGGSV